MNQIPVVDLSSIAFPNVQIQNVDFSHWKTTAKEISKALHNLGFVYLINHGLDKVKIDSAFRESKVFFEQSIEEKIRYKENDPSKGYHGGYHIDDHFSSNSKENGRGTNIETNSDKSKSYRRTYEFDFRESFDIAGKRVLFSNSDKNAKFQISLLNMEDECRPFVKVLMKLLGMALELDDEDYFVSSSQWTDNLNIPSLKTFRSLYYPAIPEELEIPQGQHRVKEHSDFGFLTLLFQHSIGGLEIKTNDGNWLQANPIADSILINIGDMLDVWTGGYFPATRHRVQIPSSERKKRTHRQSIVYFIHPDNATLIKPLKSKLLKDYFFEPRTAYEDAQLKLSLVNSY